MRTEHTACILCSRNCGLQVEIKDGQFGRIRGDDATPGSKGYICQKAARLTHYQSHADRLQHPLKRQADGSFARVGWDEALDDIAARLNAIRTQHGGRAFAAYGGGGQGNHVGGAYFTQLLPAMGSRYLYTALGQEKTGDFWVNGRMFGRQTCHTTEDVEHADFLLVIGANPFQSHGIPSARDTLQHISRDPQRTLVVVDPRVTETARMADIHLQLRPGTDAFLMAAMLGIIVQEGLCDRDFLAAHCDGFDRIEPVLAAVPVIDYVARADLPLEHVRRVARGYAGAARGCLRVDLGLQQSLNSTLNSWLEKLLFLVTGHFGKRGGNNLHSMIIPLLGHSDERNPKIRRTAHNGMFPVAGIYPPNLLASEIDNDGPQRIRAMFVDSGNPALTVADTAGLEKAFARLDLLVVVDVTLTETARLAHYVLPAASQYEKVEATGFNLEFPENYFHLRHPVFVPPGETLPEPEIYTRLLEKMGVLPPRFALLERAARWSSRGSNYLTYTATLFGTLLARKHLTPFAASVMYRTLGRSLGPLAGAAFLLPLAIDYARRHGAAVRRAGRRGHWLTLGAKLFNHILDHPEGIVLSEHRQEDVWSLVRTPNKRIQLVVAELLPQLQGLSAQPAQRTSTAFPLVLMAGERRSYNANQIYRNPAWRKTDPQGALHVHPHDAARCGVRDGERALCKSENGAIEVLVKLDPDTREGFVTLPHGYGMRYQGSDPIGPQINRLTSSGHRDALIGTPFHKHVPVDLRPLAA